MTTNNTISSDQNDPFDGIKESKGNKLPSYFTILFFGLIIWGVIFMGYYLLSGWSSDGEFQQKMNAHQERISQGMQSGK